MASESSRRSRSFEKLSEETEEQFLRRHYRSTASSIVNSLNTLVSRECPNFPYRFKSIYTGDLMYDEDLLMKEMEDEGCIYPEFSEDEIIVYAHPKFKTKDVASYLEFEILDDKSEVHILASCTHPYHRRKNLSILLRFIPIFAMLYYKLDRVGSDTNEISGALLVKKLGFTRTDEHFQGSGGSHYHQTYLRSANINSKYLKEEFVNTVCGIKSASTSHSVLRDKSESRTLLSNTKFKQSRVAEDIGNVNEKRVMRTRKIEEQNKLFDTLSAFNKDLWCVYKAFQDAFDDGTLIKKRQAILRVQAIYERWQEEKPEYSGRIYADSQIDKISRAVSSLLTKSMMGENQLNLAKKRKYPTSPKRKRSSSSQSASPQKRIKTRKSSSKSSRSSKTVSIKKSTTTKSGSKSASLESL